MLDISHFDISGKDSNELHSLNILLIFLTFEVFQFDMSGNDINELHPENAKLISII